MEEKAEFRKMLPFRGYGNRSSHDVEVGGFYQLVRSFTPVQGSELPTFIQDMVNIDSLRISQIRTSFR